MASGIGPHRLGRYSGLLRCPYYPWWLLVGVSYEPEALSIDVAKALIELAAGPIGMSTPAHRDVEALLSEVAETLVHAIDDERPGHAPSVVPLERLAHPARIGSRSTNRALH